jgi:hypothetical protein
MKLLIVIAKLLPVILDVVLAVEARIKRPGATKETVAMRLIQTVADATGHEIPDETLRKVIVGIVDVFNATGVFQHKSVPK